MHQQPLWELQTYFVLLPLPRLQYLEHGLMNFVVVILGQNQASFIQQLNIAFGFLSESQFKLIYYGLCSLL